jgi:hypothetical protein
MPQIIRRIIALFHAPKSEPKPEFWRPPVDYPPSYWEKVSWRVQKARIEELSNT